MILTAIENQDHRKKLGKSGYQKGYPMFFTEFQIYLWALWHPEKKKKWKEYNKQHSSYTGKTKQMRKLKLEPMFKIISI